jgi:hypothetical protein
MTNWKCPTCGNRYHWHHAFAKFGYDDGDEKWKRLTLPIFWMLPDTA